MFNRTYGLLLFAFVFSLPLIFTDAVSSNAALLAKEEALQESREVTMSLVETTKTTLKSFFE